MPGDEPPTSIAPTAARPPSPTADGAARGHAEERPARDAAAFLGFGLGVGHAVLGLVLAQPAPVMVVVSRDSGSPTASTAAASSWTSAGVSSS